MKKLSELYTILLEFYKKLPIDSNLRFICNAIEEMKRTEVISYEEFTKLNEHFQVQRPSKEQYTEFFVNISCRNTRPHTPWWYLMSGYLKEGIEIREKFLKKLVKETKKQKI